MNRTINAFCLAVASTVLLFTAGCGTMAQSPKPVDNGGITDDQIRDVIKRVANHQIHTLTDGDYPAVTSLDQAKAAKEPVGIMWGYPWGVALYGMEQSADITQNPDADQFVVQHDLICGRYYVWLAGLEKQFGSDANDFTRNTKIKGLMTLGSLDNCGAMGNQMLESMLRHPDQASPEEKEVVARIADWVEHKQARMHDGTLWRPTQFSGTVWPDDLYMGGVLQVRWGIYTRDQQPIDDTAKQIINQAALEEDSDGLWFHGYFVSEKQHAPYKWGRGNGWVTVTLVETLSAMPDNDPLRPQLLAILKEQIEGLKKVQAPDGMWRQLLDKPDLWEETSCTAMFAYGIARAVNRGWIDESNMVVARRAFAGLSKNVQPDGVVVQTCQGTSMSHDLNYYIQRPRLPDDPHGRGPVMLAGAEILAGDKK
jgi:unsaturated rhamnogalacturonyl hydrolase